MSKYDALGAFLKSQPGDRVPMSFVQIERVTGTKLPPSASKHRPWWSNNPSNSVITRVWLDAGFESEQVDMATRRLVFRRVRQSAASPGEQQESQRSRHPLQGALKGLVRVMPGTDLTGPADPDWGGTE
jgi:hypothetical protein